MRMFVRVYLHTLCAFGWVGWPNGRTFIIVSVCVCVLFFRSIVVPFGSSFIINHNHDDGDDDNQARVVFLVSRMGAVAVL